MTSKTPITMRSAVRTHCASDFAMPSVLTVGLGMVCVSTALPLWRRRFRGARIDTSGELFLRLSQFSRILPIKFDQFRVQLGVSILQTPRFFEEHLCDHREK